MRSRGPGESSQSIDTLQFTGVSSSFSQSYPKKIAMKLFLGLLFVAVALQAPVNARPQPFIGDLLSFFGMPQQTADQVETQAAQIVTPATVSTNLDTTNIQNLMTMIKALPFWGGKAVSNPFATFLNSVLTSMKNTASLNQSAAATSMLDTVTHIISGMDPNQDPINSLVQQTTNIGNSLAGGVIEVIPDMISIIGQSIFPVQSRNTIDDVLGSVQALLQGIVNTVSNVFTGALGLPQAVVDDALLDVNTVINNLTHISTTKGGVDGGFDIALQAVASGILIIDTLNASVHQLTDPIINGLSSQMNTAILNVNTQLDAQIVNALNNLAGGSMKNCSAPLTNSISVASNGLNDAVQNCLRTEVNTLVGPLGTTKDALNATSQALSYANRVVDSCMAFNLWDCAWNVAPAINQVMAMTGSFAMIPTQATLIYSNVQTRLPTCIAVEAVKAVTAATAAAAPLLTCML